MNFFLKKHFGLFAVVLGSMGYFSTPALAVTNHWHYINAATCTPSHPSNYITYSIDGNMSFRSSTMNCQVYLPNGATIVSARVYGYGAYNNGLTFGLKSMRYLDVAGNASQVIPEWNSGNWTGSSAWFSSNTVSQLVDTENKGYYFYATAITGTNNSSVKLVEIYYTTP